MPTTRELWTVAWRRYRLHRRKAPPLTLVYRRLPSPANFDLVVLLEHLPEDGRQQLVQATLADRLRSRKAAFLRGEAIHNLDLMASLRLHYPCRRGPLMQEMRNAARRLLDHARVYREQADRNFRLLP
jgi:hypothetical protein